MNILLTSIGRRPYLIRWFREALSANNLSGRAIAADLDPYSPAQAFATDFVIAPRVDDPAYRDWLANVLQEYSIDLAVSINDFELSEWALLPHTQEWAPLLRLTPETQRLVEDKFEMGEALAAGGVCTPATWLGSEVTGGVSTEKSGGTGSKFITKGRYGSASRGLHFATADSLSNAIEIATLEVTTRQGIAALEQKDVAPESLVIVQERIEGIEYGVDVVCDLEGNFAAALARRKIAMRAGETDRAETVAPDAFTEVAKKVAAVVPHPGVIDIDVLVDGDGNQFVIDVNPRFGGGYPFSHLAGAHIPSAYVAWAAGLHVQREWFESTPGTFGSKYVEAVKVDGAD
ncbi:ATP-grasp domain-containing protein [Corynebacterium lubricantis]|uniref:ATP-grasp domain-containing protein n=1 Tax=Corynebacterium lubricantis TaxID=541095 RepID=UPI000380435B|nr:ATP-grasp domain-containing protein [Corynebacterium lubricantis]